MEAVAFTSWRSAKGGVNRVSAAIYPLWAEILIGPGTLNTVERIARFNVVPNRECASWHGATRAD